MTAWEWSRKIMPYLAINLLLVITFPIESVYLDRNGGPAAVAAAQLSQWVFMPLLVFSFGLVQPVSWEIAFRGPKTKISAFRVVLSSQARAELQDAIHRYIVALSVPAAFGIGLALMAGPLSRFLAGDQEVERYLAGVLLWRAAGLVIGTMAALGDYVCFGLGLPAFGALVVLLEAGVYCVFLWLFSPMLLGLGLSAPAVSAAGMLAKFSSTAILYGVVFLWNGWLRVPRIADLRAYLRVSGTGLANGLVSFNSDAGRAAVSPLVGAFSAIDGAVVALAERFTQPFSAFAASQRQLLFASGRTGEDLARLAWRSVIFSAAAYVTAGLLVPAAYGPLMGVLTSGQALSGRLALPLAARLVAGLVEVAAVTMLTAAMLLEPSQGKIGLVARISAIAHWLIWVPSVYMLAVPFNLLSPISFALSIVGLGVVQLLAVLLASPALRRGLYCRARGWTQSNAEPVTAPCDVRTGSGT